MRTALVATAVACACGGKPAPVAADGRGIDASSDAGPDPNEGAVSGTRLKLAWLTFGDGTRTWTGFYDAQRKESCEASLDEPWPGGHVYCVPDHRGTIVYSDAACTQKLVQVARDPSCPKPPPSYVLEGSSTCGYVAQHLYTRSDPAAPATVYQHFADGTCDGPLAAGPYDYYQLGIEVQPNELVELVLGAPTSAARLSERFYQTADGLKLPGAIHDATLGVECQGAGPPGNVVCLPAATPASYFHDAACTQAEAAVPASCPAPTYLVTPDACPSAPPHLYSAGAPTPAPPLYRAIGGTCSTANASTNLAYFQTAQSIALAPLTSVAGTLPGHRLQLVHLTTPDGLSFRSGLHDSQEDVDCVPAPLPDGTIRCLPISAMVSTYFSDSMCSLPIDVVEIATGATSCGAPSLPRFAGKLVPPPPNTCRYAIELHAITDSYAGPMFVNTGLGCATYTPGQTAVYAIGPAIPVTDFAAATVSIDP